MSEKSVQKKNFIIETAKNVFVEKGYKNVTMKDVIEACDISRGGLYLYFSSTEEIFLEVLKKETEEVDDVFSNKFTADSTAADILILFLQEQKKELLRKKNNLTIAIYEYFFEAKVSKKNNMLRKQFDTATKLVAKLIAMGVEEGVFYCEDCIATALNIMYALEGFKIASKTMGISEEAIDVEIEYIMNNLYVSEQ